MAPVQYGLLNVESTQKPLRDIVLKKARERAEFWASALGKSVGEVRKIDLACGSQPSTIPVSAKGASGVVMYYPGASPEAIQVDTTATIVFSLIPSPKQ